MQTKKVSKYSISDMKKKKEKNYRGKDPSTHITD